MPCSRVLEPYLLRLVTHLGYAPENGIPCDMTYPSLFQGFKRWNITISTPRSVKCLEWSLAPLQRLSIGYLSHPEDLQAILKILEFGGLNTQRLRSPMLVHPSISSVWPHPSRIIPAFLWTRCPRLEEFAADFKESFLNPALPSTPLLHKSSIHKKISIRSEVSLVLA